MRLLSDRVEEGSGVMEMQTGRNLQARIVERYIDTIWAIASSRYVKWFLVGYTAMSGKQRFAAYQQNGYHHFVILADQLTQSQALNLEKRLQDACKQGVARGAPYKRKYHPSHRDMSYYASTGQGYSNPTAKIHSVYIAWIDPSYQ